VDHVATVRQARHADEPDPTIAAHACIAAGAHGITAHLREDRRHIGDRDVEHLRAQLDVPFNQEMACTPEMLDIAERVLPYQVTLVPERREELTTEGGLDLARGRETLAAACRRLAGAGIRAALFVAPGADTAARSRDIGAPAIELHTGGYAHHPADAAYVDALAMCARDARAQGLAVHAGHGLTVRNVGPVAAIADIEELNIGHSIVAMSLLTGIGDAVRAMLHAMAQAAPGRVDRHPRSL
jgi:pyridoxine 5-phosphate synthase